LYKVDVGSIGTATVPNPKAAVYSPTSRRNKVGVASQALDDRMATRHTIPVEMQVALRVAPNASLIFHQREGLWKLLSATRSPTQRREGRRVSLARRARAHRTAWLGGMSALFISPPKSVGPWHGNKPSGLVDFKDGHHALVFPHSRRPPPVPPVAGLCGSGESPRTLG
jgi:hypothetical protein